MAYGLAFFALFVAVWGWATFGGYVSKTFLANPLTMVNEGFELLTKHGFLFDIGMTIWRVVGGFVLAAIIAVPLGVLMGAYKPIAAFLDKNPSGGMHHLCYEVDDILAARDSLKASGARVLGDGNPKIGAHGKPVLFLHPKDFFGTLVELEQS